MTDDAVLARRDFARRARAVLERGGASVALHLRGPRTAGRPLHALAAALAPAAREHGALLLVNDRVDVALAAAAAGVHLGRRGLLPADARRLLGPGWVGCSAGSAAEAAAAAGGGADFLLVGHLYATPSHPGEEPAGAGLVAELRGAAAGVPLVGIGGVTPERVAEVRAAGAHGVAAVRGIWDAGDPAEAADHYLGAWRDADD